MVGDPDTSIPADQPEQDVSTAQVDQRVVNTQGGDYARGDIDKRQGKFVEGDQFNFDGHFPGATVYAKSTIYQAPRESPPAFQVPYQPVPLIGRDEVLAELADLLTGDTPVAPALAIVGMAGVGKTMLAAAFAHQRQAAFPGGIFWLNMEQPDLIAGQVAACAGPGGLDLPDFPALSFDERIARVRAAWNSPLRRLIVLDNLEDPDLLGRWQPTGSGARVLITTRCDDWPRYVRRLRLPVLPRSDSIELLLGARAADLGVPCETLTGDAAERDAAAAICDLLGDLPLALAIAAALLRLNPSLRLREFQSQIESDPLFTESAGTTTMQAALREAGLPTGRERGIAATFAISYRQLQPAAAPDALALRMLHAAACCAPAPIPQELLWRVADLDPVSVEGRMAGDAAMRRLRGLGLIGAPSAERAGTVTLHRLLAAFVRQQPHPPEVLGATAVALANYTRALQDAGQIKESLALVPHLESVLRRQSDALGAEHPDTLATAHALAGTLHAQGDYAEARARYEAVLAARTRLLGAEHPDTLATAHALAVTLHAQGDYAEARARYEAVLARRAPALPSARAAIADTLATAHALAVTLHAQGDYAGARARYEAVLAARTRLLGAEHPDTLATAHNLAGTLRAQGDYAGARARYEAVLAARTRLLGAEHPDTLHAAHDLAGTLHAQGDYAEARARYEAVLAACTRLLGAEHPDTLHAAHNLAVTLRAQGDYAEARARYEAVLAACTRLLGAEHPDTLHAAHNLAVTLHAQGDYAGARARYEAVLAARTRLLGAEHPETLRTAYNLATMLYEQGDYAEARARLEAVLAACTRLLGAEHPNTLHAAHNLANTLEYSGRWQAAARLHMQTVRNSEQRHGIAHPDAVQYLLALSRNLSARGYQRAARQLLKTRLRQMPAGIWRNVVQFGLVFDRARAALTAILAGWIAGGLVEHTGGGQILQVCVVVIAVLSYWSRPALIALFALAGAALAAPISSGLPAPWSWVCLALAALIAGGLVPYGAPVIAWLLSVSRVRLLIQPIGRRFSQLLQRTAARLQSDTED
jgi:tetratricopeptide (TPR) repeat protein